ncbi:MAG: hypothetical protein AB7V06_25650 [Candidatus Obscuribacterales bacterium]
MKWDELKVGMRIAPRKYRGDGLAGTMMIKFIGRHFAVTEYNRGEITCEGIVSKDSIHLYEVAKKSVRRTAYIVWWKSDGTLGIQTVEPNASNPYIFGYKKIEVEIEEGEGMDDKVIAR